MLRDGSTVHVRPAVTTDVEALAAFLDGLSPDARWFRFLGGGISAARAAQGLIARGFGLVATAGADGHRRPCRLRARAEGDRAEIAFEVAEARHGLGIGTILLAHLAEAPSATASARSRRPSTRATTSWLGVLRDSGFPVEVTADPGELHFELPASLDAEAAEHFEDRDRIAAVAAVATRPQPTSVALIGASRRRASVGAPVLAQPRHRRLSRGTCTRSPACRDARRARVRARSPTCRARSTSR